MMQQHSHRHMMGNMVSPHAVATHPMQHSANLADAYGEALLSQFLAHVRFYFHQILY